MRVNTATEQGIRPDEAARLLEIIGASVAVSDAVKQDDPAAHTAYGPEEAQALGLEGWVAVRAATMARLAGAELNEANKALASAVGGLCDGYQVPRPAASALDELSGDVQGQATLLAERLYLQGFHDGRVVRLASEVGNASNGAN